MRHTPPLLIAAALAAAAMFAPRAGEAAGPEYVAYDVGPADERSQIFGMNAAGAAVGSVTTVSVTRALYWPGTGAAPFELEGLGGMLTRAFDINGSGEIVGLATDETGVLRPVYWRRAGAAPVQLQDLGAGGRANAINDRGHIVGNVGIGTVNNAFPAHWANANTPPVVLATLGETGGAADINNRGRIVGTVRSGPNVYPVFWEGPGAVPAILNGANANAAATAINDRGHIVGHNPVSAISRAAFWQWASWGYWLPVDLGSLVQNGPSQAVAINDVGEIVGWSGGFATAIPTSWRVRTVRTADGVPEVVSDPPEELPGLGGAFARPQAINNAGHIGGESAPSGTTVPHATLWLKD